MCAQILNLIRMIWTLSPYYNSSERISGLLRKVSNQIIIQCTKKIDLNEIWEGDVEASMRQLQESIACCTAWRELYQRVVSQIAKSGVRRRKLPGLLLRGLTAATRRTRASGTSNRRLSSRRWMRSRSVAATCWRSARASCSSHASCPSTLHRAGWRAWRKPDAACPRPQDEQGRA